ncbi:MAG: FMN-binding negative transcriptional regulator, partial [Bryobacteraceae bacterium]|nr:FMN-binding negative transcriptional regulator [Bryobacteraceae bacterium]
RANPQWRDTKLDVHALAIFRGAQAYISPSAYPSKKEHGRVVPTYNYVVVHAHGPLTVIQDESWLLANVRALTMQHEAGFAQPWKVEDAPEPYVAGLLRGIVGLELRIERLEGKWKVSQNRPQNDRIGVVSELRARMDPAVSAMADEVEAGLD